jgi:hypothetical protein
MYMYLDMYEYLCIYFDTGEVLCASESAAKWTFVMLRYLSVQHYTKRSQ